MGIPVLVRSNLMPCFSTHPHLPQARTGPGAKPNTRLDFQLKNWGKPGLTTGFVFPLGSSGAEPCFEPYGCQWERAMKLSKDHNKCSMLLVSIGFAPHQGSDLRSDLSPDQKSDLSPSWSATHPKVIVHKFESLGLMFVKLKKKKQFLVLWLIPICSTLGSLWVKSTLFSFGPPDCASLSLYSTLKCHRHCKPLHEL